jgi:uncharacterized membrane protein YidH (DUF202 family)
MGVSTRLAYARTFLAHERTLMARVRTASSLITFGFSIYQFFEMEQGMGKGFASVQVIGPRQFSMILIIIGVVALVLVTIQPASDADTQTGIPINSDIHGGDCRRISLNHGGFRVE